MTQTHSLIKVKPIVTKLFTEIPETKIKLILNCNMERTNIETGELIPKTANFKSDKLVNLAATDVDEKYDKMTNEISEELATFNQNGSGWVFKEILSLDIFTVEYKPIRGSSYIPLPMYLAKRKAIINLKNEDDQCFKWCIARAQNPVEDHPERITKVLRSQAEQLNWDGITFPMPCKDDAIGRFESQNPTITVNVYGVVGCEICILRVSEQYEREHKVDLLLIEEDEKRHYCLINSLSRLVSSQASKHGHEQHFCRDVSTHSTQNR